MKEYLQRIVLAAVFAILGLGTIQEAQAQIYLGTKCGSVRNCVGACPATCGTVFTCTVPANTLSCQCEPDTIPGFCGNGCQCPGTNILGTCNCNATGVCC